MHIIVWKGENFTVLQYYNRLHATFLAGDMRSRQTLETAWNNCFRTSGEMLLDWWGRFNGILAEMSMVEISLGTSMLLWPNI